MKLNIKNVLFSMGTFVFIFCFLAISNVKAADSISSAVYLDNNSDGKVETIRLTLDEDVKTCAYEAVDWAVSVPGSINVTSINGVACTGTDEFIDVAVTAGANITGGAVVPKITYSNLTGVDGSIVLDSGVMTDKVITTTDGAKPIVVSVSPAKDSINQSLKNSIKVVFSEPIKTSTLTFATNPVVAHTPTWTVLNTTLTQAHTTYAEETKYTVTLTDLTDMAATPNSLSINPYSWSFTTAKADEANDDDDNDDEDDDDKVPGVVAPGCSGGNLFNVLTGKVCVNNTKVVGCGNRTTGFSSVTGQSCELNRVIPPVVTESEVPVVADDDSTSDTETDTDTEDLGTTTLKQGSKGEAVKALQRLLNRILNLGLVVDGNLGPKTAEVIKKWQEENGLVVDGLIGPKTKDKIRTHAKEKFNIEVKMNGNQKDNKVNGNAKIKVNQ